MNAEAKIEATELQKIEEALHVLVTVAVSPEGYAGNPAVPDDGKMFKFWNLAQIMADGEGATDIQRKARAIIDRPVGGAVRRAIKTLGERLNEIGGNDLMSEVIERVADRDPARWSVRIDVMDKRWDGIGTWYA